MIVLIHPSCGLVLPDRILPPLRCPPIEITIICQHLVTFRAPGLFSFCEQPRSRDKLPEAGLPARVRDSFIGLDPGQLKTLSIAVRPNPKESPGMEGPEGKGEGGWSRVRQGPCLGRTPHLPCELQHDDRPQLHKQLV